MIRPAPTRRPLSELFGNIRRNYFRLYLNFMYFNVGRIVYLQTDVIFPYILLAPTIVAGKITLGAMNQILNAFTQVRTSFQYLVNSWSTIVELISIYQRLRGFEAKIDGEPLPSIETRDGAGVVVTVARAEPGITASTSSRRPAPARVRRRWLRPARGHRPVDVHGADRRCRQLRAAGCVAVQLQSQPAPGAFVPVRGDAVIVIEFCERDARRSMREHHARRTTSCRGSIASSLSDTAIMLPPAANSGMRPSGASRVISGAARKPLAGMESRTSHADAAAGRPCGS